MRLALSEITTVNASFAEDVAAYAAAGFDGIGIWEFKLPENDAANVALLRGAGLGVANCIPAVPSILPLLLPGMEGPPDPAERIDALCTSMWRLATYAPESVLVITGPLGERGEDEARGIVLDGLREIAHAARGAGVRLGLEPVHPGQHDSVSFVNSIADALALLDEAGLDDVGIMVDTYNLWHEPPEALAAVADRVTGLHVADQPHEPERTDRVLPGDGGTRSAEHVRALLAAGWQGHLDVEIFSTPDRFWALPFDEAARRAYIAAQTLI
ncbi:MAG TPA: sugar phosphate isomerase/epimerase family protein [Gaiellaceae bacterium]|nr:sugar phosphate isomerase/epimerase family protein [Gaiellaceae bacterium]